MKKFYVTCLCQCIYSSSIDVSDEMSFDDALKYAKEHIDEIPLGELEYISSSDVIDEENSGFEEN